MSSDREVNIGRIAARASGLSENVNIQKDVRRRGMTMSEREEAEVTITARVRVFPSTDKEAHGVVVEDFGDSVGIPVDIGGDRIAEAARRWAVQLDDDNLVFVDSDQLVAE